MPLWIAHLLLQRGQRHKQDTLKYLLSDSDVSSAPTITENMNICYQWLACSSGRPPWLLTQINPLHRTEPECLLSRNSFWNDLSIQPLFESLLIASYLYITHDSSNVCPLLDPATARAHCKHIFREEGEEWRRQDRFYFSLVENRTTKSIRYTDQLFCLFVFWVFFIRRS